MQRFYQKEWHDIPLTACGKLSCRTLPDAAFYAAFYEAFFRKYSSLSGMPVPWTAQKKTWADKVLSCLPASSGPHVLSVGCGLGYLESVILAQRPDIQLHCTEITDAPLRWLRPLLPEGRCHVGYAPDCLPPDLTFDVIYCGSIDYAMPDALWRRLLEALRGRLRVGGGILILSASLWPDPPGSIASYVRCCRQIVRVLGPLLGLQAVQFWGWMRTVEENVALCRKAGFPTLKYGPVGGDPHGLWIMAYPKP